MIIICCNPGCQKSFEGRPFRKFCSRKCSTAVNNTTYTITNGGRQRGRTKTTICTECGLNPANHGTKCNRCYWNGRKTPCVVCGVGRRQDYDGCLNCIKESSRENLIKQAKIKLGGVCVVCGITKGLDFDHIDPTTKLFGIARWRKVRVSIDEFWDEIQKCQLLCRPHHAMKTSKDLTGVGNGRNVLRELDIKYIRGLSNLGHSTKAIATEFGVTSQTISAILRGATWTHVV